MMIVSDVTCRTREDPLDYFKLELYGYCLMLDSISLR